MSAAGSHPAAGDVSAAAGDALAELVTQARAALAGTASSAAPQGADGPFAGSAADGLVRAEVAADGRVLSLVIDPPAFRMPLDDIGEAARQAVNAALDARPGGADLTPLVDVVRTAQLEARRQLDGITQGMAEVAAHVRARRGRDS